MSELLAGALADQRVVGVIRGTGCDERPYFHRFSDIFRY
jgi:hypothetical protein